ncbi:NnrU family protein [Vibrio gallaecicus]|uniref:NnrU family protein n=1 Tax=Vibrio gallaecicus TaxID=552386 RepID=UPI0010C9D919|nr:NnrU family protein [Vibrio gallaecicus]MDN3616465.1 NnrU family protein [Vibrio gallaecicus]
MVIFITGLMLFLGVHSISIINEDFRTRMVEKYKIGWKLIYSIISLVGIVFIAKGYASLRLEPVLLYTLPYWVRHLTYLLMLPVMVLFVVPYLPGKIKQVTKHPQLIAVKLWAFSHLLVNGMMADVILFGSFLIWAIIARVSFNKRETRPLPSLKPSKMNDIIAIILGIALTITFVLYLHSKLIGMPLVV